MRVPYFLKTFCVVLFYFLVHFSASVIAQNNPVQFPKLNSSSISQNEGILSKLGAFSKKLQNNFAQGAFYSNTFLDTKHGLVTSTSEKKSSDYAFLEHLGTGMNIPYASVTDSSGNIYITGAASNEENAQGDFITVKVNTTGSVEWIMRKPGTLYAVESGIKLALDDTENPIATGISWNGENLDIFTIKYNKNTGNEMWSTSFDGGHNALDAPTTMAINAANEVFIGGIAYTETSVEYLLLKYSATGQLIWSAMDTNPIATSWNEPTAIALDASGNIALTGFAAVEGTGQGYWEGYLTVLYNPEGEQIWRKPFLFQRNIDENDPDSELINTHSSAKGLAFDGTGNLIVTGTLDVSSAARMGTIKYDVNGNQQWIETYRAGEFNEDITNGHEVKIAGQDKVYVVGRHRNAWVNEGLVLISYKDNGEENWIDENQNIIQIQTAKLLLDASNLPVVAGVGYDQGTENQRVRVFRYSENGVVLNETSYLKLDSDTEGVQYFIAFSIDSEDAVYIVLNNYYTEKGGVFETVKMPFDSGANNPDWNHIFETPQSNSNTRMLNATSDSNNNTYVTGDFGVIENNAYFRNFFVAKYNEAGDVAWQKAYNQQNGNESNGIVAKIDSEQNLVVFLIPSPETTFPLRIKKYAPSGELIWETEKEIHNALLRAFFLDMENNIYVAGNSKENNTDAFPKFTTIKFSAEGNEIWTQFETTNNPDDFLFEINAGSADNDGNIILTGVSGFSTMMSQVVDLTVLKYSSNGTLQWLNKYPQPNFGSAGIDLSIDSSNAIYVSGVQQEIVANTEELVALKIDAEGSDVWTTAYGQSNEGRRIRPYKIMKNTAGNLLIPSYSLYWVIGETPNNRITSLLLNKNDGAIEWENNTEIGRYYRDSYLDAEDNLFILNQTGEFSYKKLSSHTLGALMKIDGNGQDIEETFYVGPELPDFDPNNIIPLNNGTLLLGGTLYTNFFSGLYYFESTHAPLGVSESDGQLPVTDWLGQNYPNPVTEQTTIPFYLKNGGSTTIAVYDSLGRKIYGETKMYNAGENTLQLNLAHLHTGIYYYQINTGNYKKGRKLIKQ